MSDKKTAGIPGAELSDDYSADPSIVVYHGELDKQSRILRRGTGFLVPGIVWVALFLALPLVYLTVMSFASRGTYGQVIWSFSLDNLTRLLGYGFFGWSPDNLVIIGRSLLVAVVTTTFCILLSYPLAFFIAARPPKKRGLWLTLILIPFWTNLVIRTYAWYLVLGPDSILTSLAVYLGFIEAGKALYPSAFAVYLGMISTFLPFVALPIYSAVEKLDRSLLEAVTDLYGRGWRTFRHAVLPQTKSGLSVGITLTLVPAMGMFVVPDMLSGARYMLVGNLIQQQFSKTRDWPFGSMVSLSLMALTLVILFITRSREVGEEKRKS